MTQSFTTGSVLSVFGSIQLEVFCWDVTVAAVSEKAVKFIAPGTKYYVWVPKSAFVKGSNTELKNWGAALIHGSYISKYCLTEAIWAGPRRCVGF